MFSILRSSLNNASYTQYRRSAINVYKNTFKSNLDTHFSNSNSIPQVTRNYSLFRNSQHNRRWQKIFKNLCPPEKTSGIRSFRQKVFPKLIAIPCSKVCYDIIDQIKFLFYKIRLPINLILLIERIQSHSF